MQGLSKKLTILAASSLLLLASLFLAIYILAPAKTTQGSKQIGLTIIHADQSKKELTINTDSEYLRGALDEHGLIAGDEGPYGFFIQTVDNETADTSLQQWWCITKGGEMHMLGVDQTPINDADHFELTLMTGY